VRCVRPRAVLRAVFGRCQPRICRGVRYLPGPSRKALCRAFLVARLATRRAVGPRRGPHASFVSRLTRARRTPRRTPAGRRRCRGRPAIRPAGSRRRAARGRVHVRGSSARATRPTLPRPVKWWGRRYGRPHLHVYRPLLNDRQGHGCGEGFTAPADSGRPSLRRSGSWPHRGT
jgi:hypothetical protein